MVCFFGGCRTLYFRHRNKRDIEKVAAGGRDAWRDEKEVFYEEKAIDITYGSDTWHFQSGRMRRRGNAAAGDNGIRGDGQGAAAAGSIRGNRRSARRQRSDDLVLGYG